MLNKPTKSILVTGIGGNVGQGILRNIRKFYDDTISIVGTDFNPVTAGHFFCDQTAQLPIYSDDSYLSELTNLCQNHSVDLIIPSTDGEVVMIGRGADSLPPFVGSPPETTSMCLDKLETSIRFRKANLPFASSCLPSEYDNRWDAVVAKPREGRGSRGVHYLSGSCDHFPDTYVIQEQLTGPEITIAFYRSQKGDLIGPITMERELHAGTTWKCAVTSDWDTECKQLVENFCESFEVVGPCNIQAIAPSGSSIVPFELNCRYSGTNSFRSYFGFSDVRYGIDEFLFGIAPSPEPLTYGSALRLTTDIIYPDTPLDEIAPGKNNAFHF